VTRLLDELEADWDRIADDPTQLHKIAPLQRRAGVETLRALQAWTWRGKRQDINTVLLALARRSRDGDHFAARVLLHLLWPGVLALTGRWQALGDVDERASAVVAAVYARVCSYPCERRPRSVAANVLLDAEKELRRQAQCRLVEPIGLDPIGANVAAPTQATSAAEDLLELLAHAVAVNVLSPLDARLVAENRIAGRPVAAIGGDRHVRALQRQRRAAEARLVEMGTAA